MWLARIHSLFYVLLITTTCIITVSGKKPRKESDGKKEPLAKSRDLEFTAAPKNISVAVGQDAEFYCRVRRITARGQSLQLVWIRLDTQTVLAIERQLVQNNPRISVSQLERLEYTLRIKNVEPEDSGVYGCRINTKPFLQMKAHLDVLVPPVIVPDDTTENEEKDEGEDVTLKCKATGNPLPVITWTREDGAMIRPKGQDKTHIFKGSHLQIRQLSRHDMASYICLANNGVPPAVSQRIQVKVLYKPYVWVEPRYVAGWVGGTAELKCEIEAWPSATLFWYRDGNPLTVGDKYDIRNEEVERNRNRIKTTLVIKNIESKDFGPYSCSATNYKGTSLEAAELYETDSPKQGKPRADLPANGRQQMDQGVEAPETKFLKKKSTSGSIRSCCSVAVSVFSLLIFRILMVA